MNIKETYYNLDKLSQKQINSLFEMACTNDEIKLIQHLLSSSKIKYKANIHYKDDYVLRIACRKGQLDLVDYYLTSPDLEEHADILAKDNYPFNIACSMGHLELVKYLLTSPNLKKHANLDISGFANACSDGHLEVVKYLLTSPELKEHMDFYAEDNKGFRWALENNQYDILKFFIIDMKMEKTESLSEYLSLNPNSEVEKMFAIAALKHSLQNDLHDNNEQQKKMKL
jgi:ankyrin repeat protein